MSTEDVVVTRAWLLDRWAVCWDNFYVGLGTVEGFGDAASSHVEELFYGRDLARVFNAAGKAIAQGGKPVARAMDNLLKNVYKLYDATRNRKVLVFGMDLLGSALGEAYTERIFEIAEFTLGYDAFDALWHVGELINNDIDRASAEVLQNMRDAMDGVQPEAAFYMLGAFMGEYVASVQNGAG